MRRRNQEANRRREEAYLLRQSFDNYPFGREDAHPYNSRRGAGFQRLYGSPQPQQKPPAFSPQPNSNFPLIGGDISTKNYERPQNIFVQPNNSLDSPFKKLLNKPYSMAQQDSHESGGNYIFATKLSDGEKMQDRRVKLKEDWIKELNEQRAQLARKKEEERRKQLEEEQLYEEKLKAQLAEINRAMALEQEKEQAKQIRLFPPSNNSGSDAPNANAQSLELPVKKEIFEDNPVKSQEIQSFDPTEVMKYEPSAVKKVGSPSHFRPPANTSAPKPEIEAEKLSEETLHLHNKVEMMKEEILRGKKMFSIQMKYLNDKFNLNSETSKNNGGKPTDLQLYDGKTGTVAESGVYLYEMKQNVNTKFVLDAPSYLNNSQRRNKTVENRGIGSEFDSGLDNQYRGGFDAGDKGMQTIELEALSKEIEKYSALLNKKYPSKSRSYHIEEKEYVEPEPAQEKELPGQSIQVESNHDMDGENNQQNNPETYDYYQKLEEILKDFRN